MTGYVMDDTIYPVIGIFYLIERRNKDEHQNGK